MNHPVNIQYTGYQICGTQVENQSTMGRGSLEIQLFETMKTYE